MSHFNALAEQMGAGADDDDRHDPRDHPETDAFAATAHAWTLCRVYGCTDEDDTANARRPTTSRGRREGGTMADQITVETTGGPREVDVLYRRGHLALHKNLDGDWFGRYTITHIPTGRRVDDRMTKKAGMAAVRALQADPAVSWDFTDPKQEGDPEGRKARYERVLFVREEAGAW